MNNDLSISVIIPMYNEADNVDNLITEIVASLQQHITYEIIVVDDGSTDATYQNLKKLQQTIPQLVVVKHHENAGQSVAIVTGARHAKHDWLVTLDGDGQNNPADILKLHKLCQEKIRGDRWVVVLGNREQRHDTWFRRFCSRTANRVRNGLLKDGCPDTGCSLKMFPKVAFLQLPHFNHVHRFLPALFKRAGADIYNVPVDHRARAQGVSKYGLHNRLWTGIVDLIGVFWLMKRPCHVEASCDSK